VGPQKFAQRSCHSRPTQLICKLQIIYENGESEEIVSDESWTYAYGPMVKNSVYLGVVYDARREISGWDAPGLDDETWQPAKKGTRSRRTAPESFFPTRANH
jgi:alpha-L-rhamnosidase